VGSLATCYKYLGLGLGYLQTTNHTSPSRAWAHVHDSALSLVAARGVALGGVLVGQLHIDVKLVPVALAELASRTVPEGLSAHALAQAAR